VIRELKPCGGVRVNPDVESIKMERRGGERRRLSGGAMAAFFDEDGALSLTRVEVVDASDGGLGLVCPVQVGAGVRFCLYSGTIPLPHSTGTVARCVKLGDEFRVGLRCDARRAA
jgi:hypothetical protein